MSVQPRRAPPREQTCWWFGLSWEHHADGLGLAPCWGFWRESRNNLTQLPPPHSHPILLILLCSKPKSCSANLFLTAPRAWGLTTSEAAHFNQHVQQNPAVSFTAALLTFCLCWQWTQRWTARSVGLGAWSVYTSSQKPEFRSWHHHQICCPIFS